MKISQELVDIRPSLHTDIPFIHSTWIQGVFHGSTGETHFKKLPLETFYPWYQEVISSLMRAPKIEVRVACLKEDEDVILGYAVLERQTVLHYVFVKAAWRRLGVARMLIPDSIQEVSHCNSLAKRLIPNHWTYNPAVTQEGVPHGKPRRESPRTNGT